MPRLADDSKVERFRDASYRSSDITNMDVIEPEISNIESE